MDLILSPNPSLIYAADLARIREHNWLLLGHSELSATLQSIGGDFRNVLAQGGVGLEIQSYQGSQRLFGRYDRGTLIPPQADSVKVHAWHPIDVLTYCLDRDVTQRLFGASGLEKRAVRASVLGRLTMQDTYAGQWAKNMMSAEAYAQAMNPRPRFAFFERIEQLLPDLPCFLLPFQGYDNGSPILIQERPTAEDSAAVTRAPAAKDSPTAKGNQVDGG